MLKCSKSFNQKVLKCVPFTISMVSNEWLKNSIVEIFKFVSLVDSIACVMFCQQKNPNRPSNVRHMTFILWWGAASQTPSSEVATTSSQGHVFYITGPFGGKFTCTRWFPLSKAQQCTALMFSCSSRWTSSHVANDMKCHAAHVTSLYCN